MDKDFTTEEVFNSAVSIVRNLPKEGSIKPSDELRLKLYAYFKQATHGPNDTSKPRFYQVVEGYKWDSWRKLGDMPKETAMMHYIQELKEIMKTIPVKETDVEDNKHFEDVLGKKFYDYWFNQWKRSVPREQKQQLIRLQDVIDDDKFDGYKTPIASPFGGTFSNPELKNKFRSSVLRIQRGLRRIDNIDLQDFFRHSRRYSEFRTTQKKQTHSAKMTTPVAFDTNCMTLTRFLIEEQRKYPTATGELTTLLNALQTAVKSVSSAVRKAGMTNLFGLAETINVQGEEVKRLDVLSNELFINMLKSSYTTYTMISEENENAIEIDTDKAGKYLIAFDPLDGSSNIEASVSIGSIFAIYKPQEDRSKLPTGRSIVAAGYALYGSATVIVLAINAGAHFFMLDPAIGEFILTEPNFRVKPRGNIYSVNEGYHSKWDDAMKNYVQSKKYPKDPGQKPYSSRYVGSMVADLHRTFKYGGIFMYPKTADTPNGKLRLLYECNPMAFIAEKAGGKAMAGPNLAILDVQPTKIHERTPIFIGSSEDVDEIMSEYAKLNQ